MSPLKSTRIAWSVALASLALWAFSAPIGWGQVADAATRMFQDQPQESTSTSTTVINISQDSETGTDATPQSVECPPLPPAIAQLVPTLPASPAPADSGSSAGTFSVCGPNAETERQIADLIAGHGFNATLSAHGDGCATLTINVSPQVATGSATTNLNVSVGSGRSLAIKIASEGGATHVSIGATP